jgi:hypothetical protein
MVEPRYQACMDTPGPSTSRSHLHSTESPCDDVLTPRFVLVAKRLESSLANYRLIYHPPVPPTTPPILPHLLSYHRPRIRDGTAASYRDLSVPRQVKHHAHIIADTDLAWYRFNPELACKKMNGLAFVHISTFSIQSFRSRLVAVVPPVRGLSMQAAFYPRSGCQAAATGLGMMP